MDLNRVFLIGNVTRPLERGTLPSGDGVARFTVATGSRWRDAKTNEPRESTEFHDVVAWGNRVELVERLRLRKGARVHVEGVLHHREWEDQSGQRRRRVEITLTHLIVLSAKGHGSPAEVEDASEQDPGQLGYPQPESGQPASGE